MYGICVCNVCVWVCARICLCCSSARVARGTAHMGVGGSGCAASATVVSIPVSTPVAVPLPGTHHSVYRMLRRLPPPPPPPSPRPYVVS